MEASYNQSYLWFEEGIPRFKNSDKKGKVIIFLSQDDVSHERETTACSFPLPEALDTHGNSNCSFGSWNSCADLVCRLWRE